MFIVHGSLYRFLASVAIMLFPIMEQVVKHLHNLTNNYKTVIYHLTMNY